MRILALDLANKTGFAHNMDAIYEAPVAGTILLASAKEITALGKTRMTRRCDPRVCRLMKFIWSFGKVDLIVFEDVQFVKSTGQGQLWPALRSAIWAVACPDCSKVIIECVPVPTLKKFATGSGGADKVGMCKALVKQDRRYKAFEGGCDKVYDEGAGVVLDDNAVDAIWLYKWAKQHIRL